MINVVKKRTVISNQMQEQVDEEEKLKQDQEYQSNPNNPRFTTLVNQP